MVENETKVPKKRWPDRTQTQRTARRREKLNVIAKQHGFDTWAKLETAVLNGAGLAVFVAPEAYEVSGGKYYLTTTGNVGLGEVAAQEIAVIAPIPQSYDNVNFVLSDGVYHLKTTKNVGLGEFTAASLVTIVPEDR